MSTRRLFAVVALAFLAAGCTVISSVGLRHPKTRETVRCAGYRYWSLKTWEAQEQEQKQKRCIEEYEQAGYVRVWQ